ncbi:WD40-repeat-containing domain protein [Lipomyces arxii]|uniref:WD40-repeat-containing domain protein n=1 Tax=Lipomyces arxii TaxID=56418 RepID=UPI0034CD77A5
MTMTDSTVGPASAWTSKTFGTSLSLHLERPVGAMTISPSGRDVVLASRSGLYVVDLDDPYCPPRFLRHSTLWEVADVQWSPHSAKYTWVISASNQKAMVWNMALPSRNAIEHVLHAHTRAITDINFHAHDPERLATCAVDAFVHCWDMRTPGKPVQSFCDWRASATQVKWNRRNPHVVASSHDRFVRIWDDRMGAKPLRSINAHSTKIYGVDFNRVSETKLITCSLDKTVKYWDYSNGKDEPARVITTDFPVWRARHTPFGDGCLIMPQRGGKNSLSLVYNQSEKLVAPMVPVKEFLGHTEPVKEFLWRTRGGEDRVDDREFQLVTWSKDHDLRLWTLENSTLDAVHHHRARPLQYRLTRKGTPYVSFSKEPELPDESESGSLSPLNIRQPFSRAGGATSRSQTQSRNNSQRYMTRRGKGYDNISHLNWVSGVRIGRSAFARPDESTAFTERGGVPENLGEEVSMVGNKFPKVTFEKINVGSGHLVICLNGPWGTDNELVFVRVSAHFPLNYPRNQPPKFSIEPSKNLSESLTKEMDSKLDEISMKMTSHGKYCLEVCMRFLMGEKVVLDDLAVDDTLLSTSLGGVPSLDDDGDSSSDDEIIMSPPK